MGAVFSNSTFGPREQPHAMTALAFRSALPGPIVAITANIHGDECTGTGAIHALASVLEENLLKGSVLMYPSLNPEALEDGRRDLPASGEDLNRLFPGHWNGSRAERRVRSIWQEVIHQAPAAILDLHSDSPLSIPYTIMDRPIAFRGGSRRDMELRIEALARATGLTVLWDYPDSKYRNLHLDRSLAGSAINRAAIPAITIEVGPRRHLDPAAVKTMNDAVWGVLAHMGMVKDRSRAKPAVVRAQSWYRADGPVALVGGILAPLCNPGLLLEPGMALAEIRNLDGEVMQTLRANCRCLLLGIVEKAFLKPGDCCATLGLAEQAR